MTMLAIEPGVALILILFVLGGGGLVGAGIREFRRSQERKRTQLQNDAFLRTPQQRNAGAQGGKPDETPAPPTPPAPRPTSPERPEEPPPG
jgi:hypothetical protein